MITLGVPAYIRAEKAQLNPLNLIWKYQRRKCEMQSIAPTIIIRDATLVYQNNLVFKNLNLLIEGGQVTCLLGPSGVGKSSLLRLIAGLHIDNINLNNEKSQCNIIEAADKKSLIDRIAYMAQTDLLMPWLTIVDNVLIGMKLRGDYNIKQHQQLALDLFTKVGLNNVAYQFPSSLSGGMRQRAALVRTLLENRPIVLMDEPFSAVDIITRLRLQELAVEFLKDRTVLLVTHDPLEALRMAHRIHVMSGIPAKLDDALIPPGLPPRDLSDKSLLELQAQLLRKLRAAHEVNIS